MFRIVGTSNLLNVLYSLAIVGVIPTTRKTTATRQEKQLGHHQGQRERARRLRQLNRQ